MSERLLSTSEAAQFVGVRNETIRRAAIAGRLPHTRTPGGHRRFRIRDLRRTWPVVPRVVLYLPFRFYDLHKTKEELCTLARDKGLKPTHLVHEGESESSRPLPDRKGFQQIVEMAERGEIDGFITPNLDMIGGWAIASWLDALARLGLTCYLRVREALEIFPGSY